MLCLVACSWQIRSTVSGRPSLAAISAYPLPTCVNAMNTSLYELWCGQLVMLFVHRLRRLTFITPHPNHCWWARQHPPVYILNKIMFKEQGLFPVQSLMLFKISASKYNWATTLIFHDVIDHVTNRFDMCHFLLLSCCNRGSIFNRFPDICIQIYLVHDFDLSR